MALLTPGYKEHTDDDTDCRPLAINEAEWQMMLLNHWQRRLRSLKQIYTAWLDLTNTPWNEDDFYCFVFGTNRTYWEVSLYEDHC